MPVNFNNLRHPKRDMFWVAAAGPASNFVMALGWAIVFGLATGGGSPRLRDGGAISVAVRCGAGPPPRWSRAA